MRHPEQGEDEAFVSNARAEQFQEFLWQHKRIGEVAYDIRGNVIPDRHPIFVSKAEILAMPNGARTQRTLARDGHW